MGRDEVGEDQPDGLLVGVEKEKGGLRGLTLCCGGRMRDRGCRLR